MNIEDKIMIMEGFTQTFQQHASSSITQRETACLRIQFPAVLALPQKEDLLAGWVEVLPIGFFPQEGGMGYYCNTEMMQKLYSDTEISAKQKQRLMNLEKFWQGKTTSFKVRAAYPTLLAEALPSDEWIDKPGVGFPLYRMSGSQLDYDTLLQLGLSGIKKKILKTGDTENGFYTGLLDIIDLISECCLYYQKQLTALAANTSDDQRQTELGRMAGVFANIAHQKPQNLHEAAQLVLLYAMMSGSFNFGRMDEYLGDFYVNDLKNGIAEQAELDILISFWKIINRRKTIFDGRVIIGGKGRRNPENANQFARLAMKTSVIVNDVLPQLTLRFYDGQDPGLMDMAMENIGQGGTFPMLYNDDVNIPSVAKSFDISLLEAENYVPFGCGEYTIYHRSFGTPSGVINLLKALEMAIHNGLDPIDGVQRGLQTGDFKDFQNFDDFYHAYQIQVEYVVAALAEQERLEYEICNQDAPLLMFSLLYDDCIARGKSIFNGGIRYLGGTLETYGNTNTADSLLAIKKLVFENKKVDNDLLPEILKNNFAGYEIEKVLMQKAPKYGNDITEADEMLVKIHTHVCHFAREQAQKVGLDNYLVVNINNHANTILGRNTHASADGREAYTAMANANTPSSGKDKNGLTAMLNSIVKPPTDIHAGVVQNIKFSKELFNENRAVTRALLDTYFENGGAQAMITVLGMEDLINAIKNPEKYQNLMVRVGGFSARFVELDEDVQEEILARTIY